MNVRQAENLILFSALEISCQSMQGYYLQQRFWAGHQKIIAGASGLLRSLSPDMYLQDGVEKQPGPFRGLQPVMSSGDSSRATKEGTWAAML